MCCAAALNYNVYKNIEIFGSFLTKQKHVRYDMHSLNVIESLDIEFEL